MTMPIATPGAMPPPRVPHVADGTDLAALRRSARDFEAVFLAQMLQPMVTSPGAEAPFGGGFAEDLWRGLLADEMGKSISRAGGVGIADAVVAQVLADRAEGKVP